MGKLNTVISSRNTEAGFSIVELVIVFIIIAIIVVFALPQIISSRRMFSYWGMQREMTATLRQSRQDAIAQRKPITFRYDNLSKQTIIYGGKYGALGDSKNVVNEMVRGGVEAPDINYGRPASVSAVPLDDGTDLTPLVVGAVEITFQGDGSVVDASDNPEDKAMFFFHGLHGNESAFAVSVLGASGRIKLWKYNIATGKYVE